MSDDKSAHAHPCVPFVEQVAPALERSPIPPPPLSFRPSSSLTRQPAWSWPFFFLYLLPVHFISRSGSPCVAPVFSFSSPFFHSVPLLLLSFIVALPSSSASFFLLCLSSLIVRRHLRPPRPSSTTRRSTRAHTEWCRLQSIGFTRRSIPKRIIVSNNNSRSRKRKRNKKKVPGPRVCVFVCV